MSDWSPRNVVVANRATERFAAHCENQPIGREYRSVDKRHERLPSVSLRVFTVREGEGS
jgi:hypothetical protein